MSQNHTNISPPPISILIVDDSLVFRRFLRDIFEDRPEFLLVGEAQNGIEALDMVLKTNPNVILLDLEMPLMDGMTALQHLMIHRPTPTIMFSSITEEGTARCFDTLKNGAIDFVCKDFIFQKNSQQAQKKVLVDKVRKAANLKIKAREPFSTVSPLLPIASPEEERSVVFCEECGKKEVVLYVKSQPLRSVKCSHCGDTIELDTNHQSQCRRNTFITVIGGGEGSFFNLLEIIPRLDPDMGGAIIAVIYQESQYLNCFSEYLDAISAIKVVRAREGVNIEGGYCYIISGNEFMHLKPYSAQITLQRLHKAALNGGPIDILLASVSTMFKKRAAGIIVSGNEHDGDKGMSILIKNGGTPVLLDECECYCPGMMKSIRSKCALSTSETTEKIIEIIKYFNYLAKEDGMVG